MPKGVSICPEIVEANTLGLASIHALLRRCEAVVSHRGPIPDDLYSGLGYAARFDAAVVGVALFHLTASLGPEAQLCFLSGGVEAKYRRHGVGTHLLAEVFAAIARTAVPTALVVSAQQHELEAAAAFLLRFGFEELDQEVCWVRRLVDLAPIRENPRFLVREYRGRSQGLNRAMVEMHRRGYRSRRFIADLTPELLASRLSQPNCHHLVLIDGRQLAGYLSSWINDGDCYVDSLVVARRCWGADASEVLARSVQHFAAARGCATLSAKTSSSNQAVNRLMERNDCRRATIVTRFYKQFGS